MSDNVHLLTQWGSTDTLVEQVDFDVGSALREEVDRLMRAVVLPALGLSSHNHQLVVFRGELEF